MLAGAVAAAACSGGEAAPSTPPAGTLNVAVGATFFTVTPMVAVVEAVDPLDCSVAVAVTVRVNGASFGRLSGRVRVSPASCAGVSVQLPSPLSVP